MSITTINISTPSIQSGQDITKQSSGLVSPVVVPNHTISSRHPSIDTLRYSVSITMASQVSSEYQSTLPTVVETNTNPSTYASAERQQPAISSPNHTQQSMMPSPKHTQQSIISSPNHTQQSMIPPTYLLNRNPSNVSQTFNEPSIPSNTEITGQTKTANKFPVVMENRVVTKYNTSNSMNRRQHIQMRRRKPIKLHSYQNASQSNGWDGIPGIHLAQTLAQEQQRHSNSHGSGSGFGHASGSGQSNSHGSGHASGQSNSHGSGHASVQSNSHGSGHAPGQPNSQGDDNRQAKRPSSLFDDDNDRLKEQTHDRKAGTTEIVSSRQTSMHSSTWSSSLLASSLLSSSTISSISNKSLDDTNNGTNITYSPLGQIEHSSPFFAQPPAITHKTNVHTRMDNLNHGTQRNGWIHSDIDKSTDNSTNSMDIITSSKNTLQSNIDDNSRNITSSRNTIQSNRLINQLKNQMTKITDTNNNKQTNTNLNHVTHTDLNSAAHINLIHATNSDLNQFHTTPTNQSLANVDSLSKLETSNSFSNSKLPKIDSFHATSLSNRRTTKAPILCSPSVEELSIGSALHWHVYSQEDVSSIQLNSMSFSQDMTSSISTSSQQSNYSRQTTPNMMENTTRTVSNGSDVPITSSTVASMSKETSFKFKPRYKDTSSSKSSHVSSMSTNVAYNTSHVSSMSTTTPYNTDNVSSSTSSVSSSKSSHITYNTKKDIANSSHKVSVKSTNRSSRGVATVDLTKIMASELKVKPKPHITKFHVTGQFHRTNHGMQTPNASTMTPRASATMTPKASAAMTPKASATMTHKASAATTPRASAATPTADLSMTESTFLPNASCGFHPRRAHSSIASSISNVSMNETMPTSIDELNMNRQVSLMESTNDDNGSDIVYTSMHSDDITNDNSIVTDTSMNSDIKNNMNTSMTSHMENSMDRSMHHVRSTRHASIVSIHRQQQSRLLNVAPIKSSMNIDHISPPSDPRMISFSRPLQPSMRTSKTTHRVTKNWDRPPTAFAKLRNASIQNNKTTIDKNNRTIQSNISHSNTHGISNTNDISSRPNTADPTLSRHSCQSIFTHDNIETIQHDTSNIITTNTSITDMTKDITTDTTKDMTKNEQKGQLYDILGSDGKVDRDILHQHWNDILTKFVSTTLENWSLITAENNVSTSSCKNTISESVELLFQNAIYDNKKKYKHN